MTLHILFIAPLIIIPVVLASCATPSRTTTYAVMGSIERLDSRLNDLIPADAVLERVAEGFEWSEGPVWRRDGGYLLFSDIPKNTIYRWDEEGGLSVFLRPAGYAASDPPGDELGANGLVIDRGGNLVMCDHGNRAITRLDESNYTKTSLADSYGGRRLNSPNDAVYRSNGDLYFTDPPYGLRGLNRSPDKELDFNGVFRLSPDGELTLLTDELSFPNGIAFSPDERTLYVANSDRNRPILMAYAIGDDGGIESGRVFFDASALAAQGRRGMPDGMAIDQYGNVFTTGPGGVLVLNPEGEHLGTIETGQATANCAFGDDGSTLYITADMYLARIRLSTKGVGF
jgi:gluconolactonase